MSVSAEVTNRHRLSVGRKQVTAQAFVASVSRNEMFDWRDYHVTGDVDLRSMEITVPLLVESARFDGTVCLSGAYFRRGVNLSGCSFEKKLLMDQTRIEGPLRLDRIVIGNPGAAPRVNVAALRTIIRALEAGCGRVRETAVQASAPEQREIAGRQLLRRTATLWRYERVVAEQTAGAAPVEVVANLDGIRVDGFISLMDSHLMGGLSASFAKVKSDVRLDGATIHGAVMFRHAWLGELVTDAAIRMPAPRPPRAARACRIDGELTLTSAKITGDVRLLGVTLGGKLVLQATDVQGNVLCRRPASLATRLNDGVWMLLAQVKGALDFSGARIMGTFDASVACVGGWVTFDNARISGSLLLNGFRVENGVDFESTAIGGDLMLQNASIGRSLLLRSKGKRRFERTSIGGKAWLLGIDVQGDLDISGLRTGGDLILQSATVRHNLMAGTTGGYVTEIAGAVHLNGASIHGSVEFGGAILGGDLIFEAATIDGGFALTYHVDDLRGMTVTRPRVGGTVRGESAVIGKTMSFLGAAIEGGINMAGAKIHGELLFHSNSFIAGTLASKKVDFNFLGVSKEKERAIVEECRRIVTTVHGDVQLMRAQLLGGVDVSGANISGALDFRDATVNASLVCRAVDTQRTTATRVDLETLNMTGDVDLTGLAVTSGIGPKAEGDLILRDCRIRGRVELVQDDGNNTAAPLGMTRVAGMLRLDAAEITQLAFCGGMFDERPAGRNRRPRVILERARIGRLQMAKPLRDTLDISNMHVDRLDSLDDEDSYTEMLERSDPFKKSNYLAVENLLRNAGRQADADTVHVLMRRRDRRMGYGMAHGRMRNLLQSGLDYFLDKTIGYGTTSSRVVITMLLLFMLSVIVFQDRRRVEFDLQRTVLQHDAVVHPKQEKWGLAESALFAAQLHIPIISLGVKNEVQPSGVEWKAYAMIIAAAHWVMWPLLIASASGVIRKST